MKSSLSKRDGIYIGLFLVLIVTQIPASVKNHKINVCRDKIENYYDYLRSNDDIKIKDNDYEWNPETSRMENTSRLKRREISEKVDRLREQSQGCRDYLDVQVVGPSRGPFYRR